MKNHMRNRNISYFVSIVVTNIIYTYTLFTTYSLTLELCSSVKSCYYIYICIYISYMFNYI